MRDITKERVIVIAFVLAMIVFILIVACGCAAKAGDVEADPVAGINNEILKTLQDINARAGDDMVRSSKADSSVGISEVGVIIILLIVIYAIFKGRDFLQRSVGPVIHAENTKQLRSMVNNADKKISGD